MVAGDARQMLTAGDAPCHNVDVPTFEELLTVAEVAERARVSERTVWRWKDDGRLPSIQIGSVVRFRRVDVDALLTPEAVDE
jgi:excisionase family DNA binding protein